MNQLGTIWDDLGLSERAPSQTFFALLHRSEKDLKTLWHMLEPVYYNSKDEITLTELQECMFRKTLQIPLKGQVRAMRDGGMKAE